ncbi:MAG TPA: RidA family protein [Gemmatimonadaceae bacterium]|nr:RidA family protein [Gemmatimonadaceae bacterium]
MTERPAELPHPVSIAEWARPQGYSDVMVGTGRVIVTAGMIGWDPRTREFRSPDLVQQVHQTLENVVAAVRAGGGEPGHIVRLTWYIVDRQAYLSRLREIGVAYRSVMGKHYPAMAVVIVAGLVERNALVEIEATAIVP